MSRFENSSYWCPDCGRVAKIFRETNQEEWFEPKMQVRDETQPVQKITRKEAGTTQPIQQIKHWSPAPSTKTA